MKKVTLVRSLIGALPKQKIWHFFLCGIALKTVYGIGYTWAVK